MLAIGWLTLGGFAALRFYIVIVCCAVLLLVLFALWGLRICYLYYV